MALFAGGVMKPNAIVSRDQVVILLLCRKSGGTGIVAAAAEPVWVAGHLLYFWHPWGSSAGGLVGPGAT